MRSEVLLSVRSATSQDADALADVFLRAREAAVPAIPPLVHPPADVRRWMRSRTGSPDSELWVAEEGQAAVGLLLLEESWVHSLYVAPGRTGEGIGTVLLDLAKSLRPGGLGLWVFVSNTGARRFYERHGFVELRRTDGSSNEEGAPDIEMAWPAPTPRDGPP
jgi:ribosomal protein S18 acetylase RimI-like enzyme